MTELRVNIEIYGDIFNDNEATNGQFNQNGKAYLTQLINLRNRSDEGLHDVDVNDDEE